MVGSGLLAGALDDATMSGWPRWAREHVDACPICRAILDLQTAPGEATGTLAPADPPLIPPPPSLEDLAARAAKRFRPNAGELLLNRPSFQDVPGDARTLELVATPLGYRASHPLARGLALYGIPPLSPPCLLGWEGSHEPGVSLEVFSVPEETRGLIAVATPGHLDADMWRLFLADWFQVRPESEQVPSDPADRVHFAWLAIA